MLEKLSPVSLKCFDAAKQHARRLKSSDLNPRHLLLGVVQQQRDWFENLLKPYNLSVEQVMRALETDLGTGAGQVSAKLNVSAELKAALQDSVALAQDKPVTPTHLLLSLLRTDERTRALFGNLNIQIEQIQATLDGHVAAPETVAVTPPPPQEASVSEEAPSEPAQPESTLAVKHKPTPTLDRYSRDLTQLALKGELYPVIGRDREIAATIEILCRQMKRNPILVGEPGVGKTALAEGLAQRIVEGNVPPQLQDKRLIELSISSLVAGASQIGEFEKRLRKLISEVKEAEDVILFIDEAHALMGAGGMYGLQDAATILKPALARGDIVCIGSTTTHEYRKYIEKDGALARRFQPVRVEEPDRADVLRILETLKPRFEGHFGVDIPDDLLPQTYDLARNYLKNRYFPDKAIDLLERATSRAMLTSGTSPDDWGEPTLTIDTMLSVLSDITGIPLEKLDQGEMERYLRMEEILRQRVIGQEQAIQTVSSLIRLTKRRLDLEPKRPDGVFLFIGPAGVGKTELAKALTEFLFGDEERLIRLDMSEFSSEFTVSRLIGSPPGYVGYDQGGQLTEQVHQQPFCVILLDEIEKAHQAVLDLFLQVFDDGHLTDAQGRTVHFSDATIIMTSNLASDLWLRRRMGFGEGDDAQVQVTEEAVMDVLRRKLSSEFLSRVDEVAIFRPLQDRAVAEIARAKLDVIVRDRFKRQDIQVSFTPQVVEYVVKQGYDPRLGCRRLERVIQKEVLEPLAEQMYHADWQKVNQIRVDFTTGQMAFHKEA
ncbi:MAG: ATP-dependent Clp protease ATP-binding subunit [Anaerolineae bacterium]|nr:ATP-dependent Clp protease ATP-binding subunit [Anaerolineae bacterium]